MSGNPKTSIPTQGKVMKLTTKFQSKYTLLFCKKVLFI